MSAPQPTRAELYERIRASSKDAVVLAEMQRMGFWPDGEGEPQLASQLIEREAELVQQILQLRREQTELAHNPERVLRRMHQARKARARQAREDTRRRQLEARHQRALAWHAAQGTQMDWLGEGTSAGLGATGAPARPARLRRHGLPELESGLALARAMGISLPELRFLATHREVARTTHYRRFTVPKKTGGQRLISAPMPRLKRAQYWVLDQILAKVPVHDAAHGFVPARGIVSNAAPHTGQDVVVNLDLQDFFPSIRFPRIKGVFLHLGYGEAVATALALLCSEARADALTIDGETVHIAGPAKARVLPQGAPTSPQITNVLCRRLDRRLAGVAARMGFAYTRYADDLSFSASGEAAGHVGKLLRQVRHIVREEGFTPHPTKQAVMRRGRQQTVTGLVVNGDTPGVSREQRRRLRAALHRAQTQGLAQARWQQQPVTRAQLVGWAQFVHQVQPGQGQAMLGQALRLLPSPQETLGDASAMRHINQAAQWAGQADKARLSFRSASAQGLAPALASGAIWWQPAARPAPELPLTDQQRREQRQQARHAKAASQSPPQRSQSAHESGNDATAIGTPAAQNGGNAGHAATRRNLIRYLLQVLATWALGLFVPLPRFMLIACVLLVGLFWLRKQSWGLWVMAMGLAAVLAHHLR